MSFAPAVGVDEVPDPWYGAADDYEHALDLISEAIDGLLRALP
jgi:protein-tyrosine phosphatase